MDDFRIVVLGDSILWGQGLHPSDKMVERFAAKLAPALGGAKVVIDRYAHSEALTWSQRPGDSGPLSVFTPHPGPLLPPPAPADAVLDAQPVLSDPDPARREALGEPPSNAPYTWSQLRAEARAQRPA